jgi:hypothetical protein
MAFECALTGARCWVPKPYRIVTAAGRNNSAVCRKGHRPGPTAAKIAKKNSDTLHQNTPQRQTIFTTNFTICFLFPSALTHHMLVQFCIFGSLLANRCVLPAFQLKRFNSTLFMSSVAAGALLQLELYCGFSCCCNGDKLPGCSSKHRFRTYNCLYMFFSPVAA